MASRSGFDAVLIDSAGAPMSNISVTVLKSDGTQATVYQSKTGSSIKAQPIITESGNGGLIQFWADPGYYQVRATDLEVPARIATRFIPFDAVAGDMTGGIDADQVSLTNEITAGMIQNNAITTNKIGDSQVTAAKIAANAITGTKISDGAITTSKIGDAQVTAAKLADGVLNTSIPDGSITSGKIADGAVSETKLANSAVTINKIANQAVVSGKLKVQNYVASLTTTSWSSSTPANHVISQISSVVPGIYLAIGELTSTNVSVLGPGFTSSGGTASINQIDFLSQRTTGGNSSRTIAAIIEVSSTTTVQLVLGKGGPSGSVSGGIQLFGFAAS